MRGGEQFVVVDADTQQRQPAFDHEKIAASLSKAAGNSYKATALPFNTLAFTPDGSAFTVNVDGSPYRCTVADSELPQGGTGPRAGAGLGVGRRARTRARASRPTASGKRSINNFNVAVRQAGTRDADAA